MTTEAAHRVFFDDERTDEFKGQDPSEPTDENKYQPFLSRPLVVEMLGAMGILVPRGQGGGF